MAESDPPNPMDDEDLEDGEIETDEENDVAMNEVAAPPKVVSAPAVDIDNAKKPKPFEDDAKKITEAKAKGDNRKSAQDNNTKNKKLPTGDVAKGKQFPPPHSCHFDFMKKKKKKYRTI